MDLPALKLAEIVIVVVGLVAFYVWQMRSLKRDRAELARRLAQQQAESESAPTGGTEGANRPRQS
jgi:hypothetical protein